jgi:hypothetical protein
MWSSALSVLVTGLSAPILIAAHRFILANDRGARYDFRPRRTRLFLLADAGWALLFGIGLLALLSPAIPQDGSAWWWWVVAALPCIVIIGLGVRLSLAFPLIALDQPSPFRRSFAMTKGRWWRICTINFIIPIVALTVGSVLIKFAAAPPSPTIASHVLNLISAMVDAFVYLAGACALSFTFLWIVIATRQTRGSLNRARRRNWDRSHILPEGRQLPKRF